MDIIWIPETRFRSINDSEVASLANEDGRSILTRDSDFLALSLRRRARYGVIYIAEPVRRDNVEMLSNNVIDALEIIKEKPSLVVLISSTIELYRLHHDTTLNWL